PKTRNPVAIDVNGSWPRPSSPSDGTLLLPPDSDNPSAPISVRAIRRERSATPSSWGSQMPLLAMGTSRLSTATAAAVSHAPTIRRRPSTGRSAPEPEPPPEGPESSRIIAARTLAEYGHGARGPERPRSGALPR